MGRSKSRTLNKDMTKIAQLEPKEVFSYFETICGIPHGSYHEKALSDYCVQFAKEHGLQVMQDELYNVIIKKDATKGYEQEEPLIIQGHLDMVCEKKKEVEFDFETQGLRLETDGKQLFAVGTTLGGDDGIAIAYALAILASDTIRHPALEVVFTVSEEVGMEGAAGIDLSACKGKRLLNIDSEEEGIMLSSCAGGVRTYSELPISRTKVKGDLIRLELNGLTGGHSGVEIHKWRANANVLMGRLLLSLNRKHTFLIAELRGGLKDNAIPRESYAEMIVSPDLTQRIVDQMNDLLTAYKNEYRISDPGMELGIRIEKDFQGEALDEVSSRRVIGFLNSAPNGIQAMSMEIDGLVETSLNLGIMELKEDTMLFTYAIRSSKGSAKDALCDKMCMITELFEGSIRMSGNYPAWEFKKDSAFRDKMCRIYHEMYGVQPLVEAVHAGLECGLLSEKIEDLDCVSIGPNMSGIHTTEEKLDIASVKRVWEYILRLLETK